ncbi:hypothetical protein MMC10_007285 [Thelotrema lepadinum]|nr:hypothetical protein [Thelotrema lepadinum]
MESYRRILDELVRQVEEQEDQRQKVLKTKSRSSMLDLDEKIERLDSHIRALSQATKTDLEAHDKLLDFMQRITTVVSYDSGKPATKPLIQSTSERYRYGPYDSDGLVSKARVLKASSSSPSRPGHKRYNFRKRTSQARPRTRTC